MILDSLQNARNYATAHPRFQVAFDFLRNAAGKILEPGRHEIDGDSLFAIVVKGKGKGREGTKLETHDKYIDIQFSVSGTDQIGWQERSVCAASSEGYDAEKDLEFYTDASSVWVPVPAGHFAIFFPEDAHAPMGTEADVEKIVVKVLVS